ncbi:unnamed protein product [Brachionus calyciflorus]|uniref:RING-type E3 ubiquitin transferase n=1 Tax=Brachionus calyciflorus TaxID=104777 RepID=A0A813TH60_9BILA|nr:unnamed protein product [Brachionus calyciflorus]
MSHEPSGSSAPQNTCKFFLRGTCRYGSNCFYSHDIPQNQEKITKSICQYFLKGNCLFGDECFNLHTYPENSETNDQFNSNIINRFSNLKFVEANLTDDSSVITAEESISTPASYYEALTGKKLNLNENLNNLDLSMFDQTYIEYLKKQQNSSQHNQILLCPYFEKQLECPFTSCTYIHGDLCDICNLACLHPFDSQQRETHRKECLKQMENEMEEAFAVQRSSERPCGICMEVVWQKEKPNDRRFGILENCNHCFCLQCIRQWRSSKAYENKIVKACPECRVKSDYVTPSKFWFDNEDDKKKIINEYKTNLGKTECKYFKRGDGTCPFGNKCFYLHRNKDGSIAQLPDPTRRRRINRFGDSELYSDLIDIGFDLDNDEDDSSDYYDTDDDDDFNMYMYLRQNMFDDLDDSDFLEFASDLFNLFN